MKYRQEEKRTEGKSASSRKRYSHKLLWLAGKMWHKYMAPNFSWVEIRYGHKFAHNSCLFCFEAKRCHSRMLLTISLLWKYSSVLGMISLFFAVVVVSPVSLSFVSCTFFSFLRHSSNLICVVMPTHTIPYRCLLFFYLIIICVCERH